jgi:hypothetical protein
MDTIKTNFKGLFTNPDINIEKIEIPRIQRSYAQGRTTTQATRVRERFLKAIHDGIVSADGLTLDFVYGNTENKLFVPLDGQQRLTTLFLLHWYAAVKEDINTDIIARFSYLTRYSARDFCRKLSTYRPNIDGPLSKTIRNEGWFPMDWRNDPTVVSMLNMIDAIQQKFNDIDHLWNKLDNVTFYFLPIEQMGLTDEIYIKMNSRGKPLTQFEHFKAELIRLLRAIDELNEKQENYDSLPEREKRIATRIGRKIDREWTDMLWPHRGNNNIIDDEFLAYFRIICDIICYQENKSVYERDNKPDRVPDEFSLLKMYFNGPKAMENILFFEDCMDIWVNVPKGADTEDTSVISTPILDFFADYIATSHQPRKITADDNELSLFEGVIGHRSKFSLPHLALLYAFITYLLNKDGITDDNFRRRLRIVWNLIRNSSNEVVDRPNSDAGNRMPAVLAQIESIVKFGVILKRVSVKGKYDLPNFNVIQLNEEREKLYFARDYTPKSESLYELEDNDLLTGRVEIFDFHDTSLYKKFYALFDCDYDLIDCALMSVCPYYYEDKRVGNIFQVSLGTDGRLLKDANISTHVWNELFHKGTFKDSKMQGLVTAIGAIMKSDIIDDNSLKGIIDTFLKKCEDNNNFPWQYYYVKYPVFRKGRFGKYQLGLTPETQYDVLSLWARAKSSNARQPFLEATGDYEFYNLRYKPFADGWLYCDSDKWLLYMGEDFDSSRPAKFLPIAKNGANDAEDRIALFMSNQNTDDWEEIPDTITEYPILPDSLPEEESPVGS